MGTRLKTESRHLRVRRTSNPREEIGSTQDRWLALSKTAAPIASVDLGNDVVVAGYVSRVTVHPGRSTEAMVVSLGDGSGLIRVSLPRDAVVMVRIGSRMVVDGAALADEREGLQISPREAIAMGRNGLPVSVVGGKVGA